MRIRAGMTAVVTGGGSGIGLALASELARRGCRLALVDVREDRLATANGSLAGATAVSTHTVDVADETSVMKLANEVRQIHGPAALLVNSAGVSVAGPFAMTGAESFAWIMRVNFDGTVNCCRSFLPQLRENKEGHIVNVGSCFGWIGFPTKSGYCASKFAVRGFTEALRGELKPDKIGVTVLYPGPVSTNIVRDGRVDDETAREREAAFLAKRGISPQRVSRAAMRGIERNAARVLVGLDYRIIDWIVRLAPSWSLALAARFGRRF